MQHLTRLFSLLCLLLVLVGCEKDKDPEAPAAEAEMTVKYDSGYADQAAAGVEIQMENVNTRESLKATTDAQGQARFSNIPSGAYNITARIEMTPAQFLAFAGRSVTENVLFQASVPNQVIIARQANPVALTLKAGTAGDFVIKQIYYAGSDRTNGAVFRDQFIELHNNTEAVLYADGLYLMLVAGNTTVPANLPSYLLANGQYDWSKAVGMPANVAANADYVYSKALFQIPGSGQQYPVQPGQSIVIAQTAVNHKGAYTGNNGVTISVRDPSLTIDLSNASFETFYNTGFASDVDNPAVPNLRLLHTFGNDMILDNLGRDAFAIFRSATDAATFPRYATPNITTVTSTTVLSYQVPKALLIDAVETQPSPTSQIPRKLADGLDAGFTYVPKGSYTSQAVIRKVSKTFGTRRVLQDTNNSANDFQVLDLPVPFGF